MVVGAAVELASRGVSANVINPGTIDTGWMSPQIRQLGIAQTPAGRLGTAADTTDLVRFLMSDAGGWITGQLLYSNGGFKTSGLPQNPLPPPGRAPPTPRSVLPHRVGRRGFVSA